MSANTPRTPALDDPLLWLLEMEMSRQKGNFAQAERAKRELERLGIRVIYRSRWPRRRRGRKGARHGQ
ncbi:hypothetical protein [Fontivita pretiosa]|uniref:hypothetical protein n=1 Tax=Fontivita pretiosa TaxID=2989684 RepID=UPI003D167461